MNKFLCKDAVTVYIVMYSDLKSYVDFLRVNYIKNRNSIKNVNQFISLPFIYPSRILMIFYRY